MFAATLSILAVSVWTAPVQGAANLTGALPFAAACATVIFLAEALHRVHGQAFAAALESAEAKRCAAALGEREAWLNAVLDGVADGIVTIDERGTIISINPALTAIFGYRPEEVTGHSVNILMPEFCREDHDRYLAEHLKSGKVARQPPAASGRPPQGWLRISDGLRRDRRPVRRQAPVRRHRPRYNGANGCGESAAGERGVFAHGAGVRAPIASRFWIARARSNTSTARGCGSWRPAGPAAVTGGRWLDMWPEKERRAVEAAIAGPMPAKPAAFPPAIKPPRAR